MIFIQSQFSPHQKNVISVKTKYSIGDDNYLTTSLNHEVYPQRIVKSTLSLFDDKRCYIFIYY